MSTLLKVLIFLKWQKTIIINQRHKIFMCTRLHNTLYNKNKYFWTVVLREMERFNLTLIPKFNFKCVKKLTIKRFGQFVIQRARLMLSFGICDQIDQVSTPSIPIYIMHRTAVDPFNLITLIPRKIDNINQRITISEFIATCIIQVMRE